MCTCSMSISLKELSVYSHVHHDKVTRCIFANQMDRKFRASKFDDLT